MKKVILLAVVGLFFANPGFSAILGSKHDLSSTGPGPIKSVAGATGTDETCVFCHTPHAANTTTARAPLWNRQTADLASVTLLSQLYGDPSGTMDAAATVAGVNSTDAPLCLSCHDGTVSADLVNPPNTIIPAGDPTMAAASFTGDGVIYNGGAELLTNDHPIAISIAAAGAEIQSPTTAALYNVDVTGDGFSVGVNGDFADGVWCSSCHDAHSTTNAPFLIMSNAGSALCTDCHIK